MSDDDHRLLSQEALDSFKRNYSEVQINSPRWGDVFIVSEKTGKDRFEITMEDLKCLHDTARIFRAAVVALRSPGGRVLLADTSIPLPPVTSEDKEEAAKERLHALRNRLSGRM